MKIDYRKSFLKELSKIPSGTRSRMENFVFEELPKANSIFSIGIVEQMKGYRSYYKVRFRMARITDGSSMKLMIRMIPRHFGQTRGSTS